MPRQIVARVFLIIAVLLAQQTALAHDFWHAAGAQAGADAKPGKANKLCDLHDLLGTVLGAVHTVPQGVDLVALKDVCAALIAAAAPASPPLAAHSRGPPLMS
jgi:hypothetical protein